MPAEWEPHAATWLSWPYNINTWEGHLEGAEQAFTEIISVLARREKVGLLVPDAAVRRRAQAALKRGNVDEANVQVLEIESGDVWIRDYGPIFVKDGKGNVAFTKWIYNAYGNKYEDLLIGNDVVDKMPLQTFARFDVDLVLEGGSIDVNGSGSLLTTESCLLSPDRNPGKTKNDVEKMLKEYLGVTNILWLSSGIAGDDTTGHVDTITRFVGPSAVVTSVEQDRTDVNFEPLQENARRLSTMKDERGNPLRVLELPMPRPFEVGGRRMAATYANFLIANGCVLVPVYDQPSDAQALATLRQCFPGREVMGIDCRKLVYGYGSIHCATQQQPA